MNDLYFSTTECVSILVGVVLLCTPKRSAGWALELAQAIAKNRWYMLLAIAIGVGGANLLVSGFILQATVPVGWATAICVSLIGVHGLMIGVLSLSGAEDMRKVE